MKAQTAIATFALTIASVAANAQPYAHANLAYEIIRGLNLQANKGIFTDADGVATNRYGASWPNDYFTVPVDNDPTSVYSVYGRCASFVTMMLKATYNWDPDDLGESPFADEYYTSILNSNHGFMRRLDFTKARYGDILASMYSNNGDTGHVMIFSRSKLVKYDPATKTREYEVTVMDCSKEQHTNDTRSVYAQMPKGAGIGQIRVKTVNNLLTEWAWRVTDSFYLPSARPIVIGFFSPQS
jgi:hypothetical protein